MLPNQSPFPQDEGKKRFKQILQNITDGAQNSIIEDEPMADSPSKDEVKFQLEAVEARTDTKIKGLEGKMDLLLAKADDAIESGRATRANVWVVGISLALLIVALPSIYDWGFKVREAISKDVKEQLSERRAAEPPKASTSAPSKP